MKIKFSEKVSYTPEWKGNRDLPEAERITVDLKVMSLVDLLNVADVFTAMGFEGTVDPAQVSADKSKRILSATADLLPRYANINGLEGEDGPLEIDIVVKYGTFQALAMEILLELASISSPNESEQKN